jgi:hypothetical protein
MMDAVTDTSERENAGGGLRGAIITHTLVTLACFRIREAPHKAGLFERGESVDARNVFY